MSSKIKSPWKKFQKGMLGIVTELITSFIFSAALALFVKDRLINSNVVLIFTLIGFVGSVSLMFSFKNKGFVFLLGWILTAWLLRGLFSPFYFVVYIVAPVLAIILKLFWAAKKSTRRVFSR